LRFDLQHLLAQLVELRREFAGYILAFVRELKQHFDIGLAARQLFIRLKRFFQAFAILQDFLGSLRVVPELGLGDLLFYLVELAALCGCVKGNSERRESCS
jgi:hypothetical protein